MKTLILAVMTTLAVLAQVAYGQEQVPAAPTQKQPAVPRGQPNKPSLDLKQGGLRGVVNDAFKTEIPVGDILRTDRLVTDPALAQSDGASFERLYRLLTKSHSDLEEAYDRMQALKKARLENDGVSNLIAGILSLIILVAYIVTAFRQPERCAQYRAIWHLLTGILLSAYVLLIANPDAPYSWLGYLVPVNAGVVGPLLMKFIGWWLITEPEDEVDTRPIADA